MWSLWRGWRWLNAFAGDGTWWRKWFVLEGNKRSFKARKCAIVGSYTMCWRMIASILILVQCVVLKIDFLLHDSQCKDCINVSCVWCMHMRDRVHLCNSLTYINVKHQKFVQLINKSHKYFLQSKINDKTTQS